MSRNIIGAQPRLALENLGSEPAPTPDNYAAKIIKLIPADIVAVYLGVSSLFSSLSVTTRFYAQSIVFLIILFITPLYLKKAGGVTDVAQRRVAMLSFVVWGISLGGPFEYLLNGYEITAQLLGGALIMLYTLVVPMLYRPKSPTSGTNPADVSGTYDASGTAPARQPENEELQETTR